MKLAGFDHPKTLALKSVLKCSFPAVIGYLELFWRFTAQHSPRGNIGKWPDVSIASACYWEGEPGEFVEALINCGFVVRSAQYRLVVHDWSEHCPQWVRAQVKKTTEGFIEERTVDATEERTEEATKERTKEGSSGGTTIPSQAKPIPSQAKANQEKDNARAARFARFWAAYPVKKAKAQAEKAWQKLSPDDEQVAMIVAAIETQQRERRAKTQRGEFVAEWKYPATWLNAKCWEDEPDKPVLRAVAGPSMGSTYA